MRIRPRIEIVIDIEMMGEWPEDTDSDVGSKLIINFLHLSEKLATFSNNKGAIHFIPNNASY